MDIPHQELRHSPMNRISIIPDGKLSRLTDSGLEEMEARSHESHLSPLLENFPVGGFNILFFFGMIEGMNQELPDRSCALLASITR